MLHPVSRPQEQFEMTTPLQWKAFSHPLRMRMLKLLIDEAHTNEELAAMVGEKSGKLYFHTKRLLDAGLIVLERTAQKGPNTEKFYRAAACRFTAALPAAGNTTPRVETLLKSALELYHNAWQESDGLVEQTELGFHLVLPLDPEKRAEFVARLEALRSDFKAGGSILPDAEPIVLTAFLYSLDSRRHRQSVKD